MDYTPRRFMGTYQVEADTVFAAIEAAAKGTPAVNFTIDGSVSSVALRLIKELGIQAGYQDCIYHDADEGQWIEVRGNPYAEKAAKALLESCLGAIASALVSAQMSEGKVHISVVVPHVIQREITTKLKNAGWTSVEFHSNQREGAYITLTL